MARKTILIRIRPVSTVRQVWGVSLALLFATLVLPVVARAHGGMGPDEVGPPLVTSGLLGFASYWIVMLWPWARRNNDQDVGTRASAASRTGGSKRSGRIKRLPPRLRKIEGTGQFRGEQTARRRASDG
ncbi:MAG: hypothetical protein HYZ50_18285 [Deltaproteobacteria bacterium]|nr:hypothetical protein [Deltaproteobacteria bacterium]